MTIATGSVIGQAGKLYRNTGTHATPVWSEMKRVKDVNVPLTKGEAEVSRRESAWEMFIGAMKQAGLSFGYQHKRGTDTDRAALADSYLNGTPIEFAVMDDDITTPGAFGFKGYFEVFEFPLDQPLKDGQTVACVCKLTEYEEAATLIEPELITIASPTTTTTGA